MHRPHALIATFVCCFVSWFSSSFKTQAQGDIQHVIYISVDGLRGHFIQTFIETAPSQFPNFVRLRNTSAFTYNARCDYYYSITNPNHACMITGLNVGEGPGSSGVGQHGFLGGANIHTDGNPTIPYKFSVFDTVHDRSLSTAFYTQKTALLPLCNSYNEENGAVDTVGIDNGRNKVDLVIDGTFDVDLVVATLLSRISGMLENYSFVHLTQVDAAGHSSGWTNIPGDPYYEAVRSIDAQLGSILNAIEANTLISNKTAVILCADHGGGGAGQLNAHNDATVVENYTIPMFVRAPGFTGGSDIYSYFTNRANPGTGRPTYNAAAKPLRNGDCANLSTVLLGLPEISGSYLKPELKRNFNVSRSDNSVTMTWPAYLTGYTLEYTDDLTVGDQNWNTINTGITTIGGVKNYTHNFSPPDARFFRIRKPSGN